MLNNGKGWSIRHGREKGTIIHLRSLALHVTEIRSRTSWPFEDLLAKLKEVIVL
jgi:hypothetical protein